MNCVDDCKYREMLDDANADLQELKDENAKLRELAKDACTVLRNHYNKEWFDRTVFADRMRELGIEVY